jgi:hypothetical protein
MREEAGIMKTGLKLFFLVLAFIALASPNYARAAADKVTAARAAAIHKCEWSLRVL